MSKSSAGGGIDICEAMFIVFLVLKLLGIGPVSTWSWWWVFAPLWMPWVVVFGVVILVLVGIGLFYLFCQTYDWCKKKRSKP